MHRVIVEDGPPMALCDSIEDGVAWTARWADLARRVTTDRARPAAVFDVDATLLRGPNQPIAPVCALYHKCQSELGLVPFVITARSSAGRTLTTEQLRAVGVDGYKRLFMHPPDRACGTAHEAGAEKLKSRARIEAHAHRIAINVGDAWHDHFHPVPQHLTSQLDRKAVYVFVTPDGVGHLKLPQ